MHEGIASRKGGVSSGFGLQSGRGFTCTSLSWSALLLLPSFLSVDEHWEAVEATGRCQRQDRLLLFRTLSDLLSLLSMLQD